MYLSKMINNFYKDYLEKPKMILPSIDSVLLMTKLTTKPSTNTKQKQCR